MAGILRWVRSLFDGLFGRPLSGDTNLSVIAAIDFGTSRSGYAFAIHKNPDQALKLSDVCVKKWQIGTDPLFTYKAPTTLLLTPEGTFDSFGYFAEDKYATLCQKKDHDRWWYFEKFKMALYKTKNLTKDAYLLDKQGKKMPAIKVFSLVIAHLKKMLLDDIREQLEGVRDDDVMYVLTVPAIWSDAAKQFMSVAAKSEEVGIPANQLKLVLEPEAAAVHCRHELTDAVRRGDKRLKIQPLPVGHEYILADLGGGTADIATHKILKDDLLQEIACARGNNLGGEKFNQKFLDFLGELFNEGDIFERWTHEEIGDLIFLQRSIEGLKWSAFSRESKEILLSVPHSLIEMFREKGHTLESVIRNSDQFESIDSDHSPVKLIGRGKIVISISVIVELFKDILEGLKRHLEEIKREVPNVQTIFLVGGMAKSKYVCEEIKSTFADCRVIVPEDHEVAVLKGAVLLGNRSETISSRKARYTYGIEVKEKFIAGQHSGKKKVTLDGEFWCDHVFKKLIEKGQDLKYGKRFTITTWANAKLPETKQTTFRSYLYQSTETSPIYVTDDGCNKLGGFEYLPPTEGWPDHCEVNVELIVGEAEFILQSSDKLGRNYETNIDFLLPSE